jgi:hypothetical protein
MSRSIARMDESEYQDNDYIRYYRYFADPVVEEVEEELDDLTNEYEDEE